MPSLTPTSTTAGSLQPTSPQAVPTAPTTTTTTTATAATTTTTARPGAVPSMPVETGQPNPYARAAYSGYRQNTSAMEPPFQQQEPAGETLLGRLGRWVDAVNSRLVETRIAGDAKGKGVAKG